MDVGGALHSGSFVRREATEKKGWAGWGFLLFFTSIDFFNK
jgi:hypothetical protein